jgi:hypothetical protein
MGMYPRHDELQSMSDEELIHLYNQKSKNTVTGTNFYIDELARRELARQNQKMLDMTKSIKIMTFGITILTVVNVLFVGYTIFK